MGSIPGSGRCPGGGNSNPLQCSCLENPKVRGAWQATVQRGCIESDTTEHELFKRRELPDNPKNLYGLEICDYLVKPQKYLGLLAVMWHYPNIHHLYIGILLLALQI